MLKLNQNQQRLPIGGHHFTSHSVTFRGEKFEDVINKIKSFRLSNALPVGDPEQEVLSYYVKNWPFMVIQDDGAFVDTWNMEYVAWRDWVGNLWRNPARKMLTTKEASLRWEVCKNCPHNVKQSWLPTPEAKEFARRAFMLRRGIDVPLEIQFCDLHKWDTPVASFIDNPAEFSGRKDQENQKGCWVV